MIKKTGKSFYKGTAALLSALILLSATGCQKDNNTESNGNTGIFSGNHSGKSTGLNISIDHSYASEKLDIQDMQYFNNLFAMGDNILLSGYDQKGESIMFIYHPDDNTIKEAELVYPGSLDEKTDYYLSANFIDSENHPVFIYHTSIWDEENEENPYQDLGYTMEIYDTDFNLLETKDLNEVFSEDTYFSYITPAQNGNYYIAIQDNETGTQKLCIYDKDFKQTGEINADIQYIMNMFTNAEGKLIVNYQDNEWNSCFGILNEETNQIDKIEVEGMPQWFNSAFAGRKDYDLFINDSTSVYGINLSAGICEEVVNWVNSDFVGDNISNVTQLQDGRFLIANYDYSKNTSSSEIWILNERDPEEFKNTQIISLATLWMPQELTKAVNQFNRTHTDYRIGVMNYDKYNTKDDYEAGLTQFENDMTSGIVADIICVSSLPYEKYANKGLFLDLSDYVKELNPDEYFMNFFDSLRYGDKLYRLGFSYNVQTLEAKTEHVNGKSGLSVSEYMDLVNHLPSDMKAFGEMYKESALSTLCTGNLASFIDVNTGTCTFNTPEFVQILEMCNSYPGYEDDPRNEWEAEEWDNYWAEESYQYINDKVLFREAYISDIKSYLNDRKVYFDKSDVTLVGYPTSVENSNGGKFSPDYTIAISANSAMQDQAWEICKMLLSEEAQEAFSWSLPVRREAYEKAAAEALKPDTYIDEEGNEVEIDNTIWRGDEEVKIPLPTQADIDMVTTYIESITESSYYNSQVYDIIYEETSKYFAGDQTAQATADMIQSRASLYLSEQL